MGKKFGSSGGGEAFQSSIFISTCPALISQDNSFFSNFLVLTKNTGAYKRTNLLAPQPKLPKPPEKDLHLRSLAADIGCQCLNHAAVWISKFIHRHQLVHTYQHVPIYEGRCRRIGMLIRCSLRIQLSV